MCIYIAEGILKFTCFKLDNICDDDGKMIRSISNLSYDILKKKIKCECEYITIGYRPMTFVLFVMCRSKILETIFLNGMMKDNTVEVNVQGCSRNSFLAFVDYIYLGSAGKLMEGADGGELYTLAETYEVAALKTYLLKTLNSSSIDAAAVYFSAHQYKDNTQILASFTKAGWEHAATFTGMYMYVTLSYKIPTCTCVCITAHICIYISK